MERHQTMILSINLMLCHISHIYDFIFHYVTIQHISQIMIYISEILIAALFTLAGQVENKKSIKAITTETHQTVPCIAAAEINQLRALSMCLQFIPLCLIVKPYLFIFSR